MQFVAQLLFFISMACALLLLIGLFRPWTVLWWEDVQNRRKVIKWYGGAAILFYVVSLALKYFG
ncbi:MAG TPA: hypothetical protein PKC24_03350 [Cyclobacteriaceae bacterium]|nr:hypothetical protein [Cyclobacteriaceae bacterium]